MAASVGPLPCLCRLSILPPSLTPYHRDYARGLTPGTNWIKHGSCPLPLLLRSLTLVWFSGRLLLLHPRIFRDISASYVACWVFGRRRTWLRCAMYGCHRTGQTSGRTASRIGLAHGGRRRHQASVDWWRRAERFIDVGQRGHKFSHGRLTVDKSSLTATASNVHSRTQGDFSAVRLLSKRRHHIAATVCLTSLDGGPWETDAADTPKSLR